MQKVFLCETLHLHSLQKARRCGCAAIVTNNIRLPSNTDITGIEIVDANQFRKEGSWYSYNLNKKVLDELKLKFPFLFEYQGQDLTRALYKHFYWFNYKQGYLLIAANKRFGSSARLVFYEDKSQSAITDLLKLFIYFFAGLFSFLKRPALSQAEKLPGKYIVFVNGLGMYQLLKRMLDKLGKEQVSFFIYQDYGADASELANELEKDHGSYFMQPLQKGFELTFFNPFHLRYAELFYFIRLLEILPVMRSFLDDLDSVRGKNTKAFITNSLENAFQGHLIDESGKRNHIKTINMMNGMKTGTANNADTSFDAWLVWDEQMKKMLMEDCFIPEQQLVNIGGHLMEDQARMHTFSGKAGIDRAVHQGKKVISFYSVRGHRKDKIDALRILYDMLRDDVSIHVLYRPHPLEKKEEYVLPDDESLKRRVFVVGNGNDNNKNSLYDQLLSSDISLVLASTVALESRWMGVPAITFEQAERSLLYCVDDRTIFHARTGGQLEQLIKELLVRQPQSNRNGGEVSYQVSSKYAAFITSFAC